MARKISAVGSACISARSRPCTKAPCWYRKREPRSPRTLSEGSVAGRVEKAREPGKHAETEPAVEEHGRDGDEYRPQDARQRADQEIFRAVLLVELAVTRDGFQRD